MTTLKCSAVTCVYNDNQLCSKGDILVAGEGARLSSETSCERFRKRGENASDCASSGCGCHEIQIDCKAQNCTYNDKCKCTASAIRVDGGHAAQSGETCCDTFETR